MGWRLAVRDESDDAFPFDREGGFFFAVWYVIWSTPGYNRLKEPAPAHTRRASMQSEGANSHQTSRLILFLLVQCFFLLALLLSCPARHRGRHERAWHGLLAVAHLLAKLRRHLGSGEIGVRRWTPLERPLPSLHEEAVFTTEPAACRADCG